MIKRIWHGWTTPEEADRYQRLLEEEIFFGIEAMEVQGLRGIDLLRREGDDEVEFVTIMTFESLDDVREFAGDDYRQAYVPPEARKVLKRFDDRAAHYRVQESRSY